MIHSVTTKMYAWVKKYTPAPKTWGLLIKIKGAFLGENVENFKYCVKK